MSTRQSDELMVRLISSRVAKTAVAYCACPIGDVNLAEIDRLKVVEKADSFVNRVVQASVTVS